MHRSAMETENKSWHTLNIWLNLSSDASAPLKCKKFAADKLTLDWWTHEVTVTILEWMQKISIVFFHISTSLTGALLIMLSYFALLFCNGLMAPDCIISTVVVLMCPTTNTHITVHVYSFTRSFADFLEIWFEFGWLMSCLQFEQRTISPLNLSDGFI